MKKKHLLVLSVFVSLLTITKSSQSATLPEILQDSSVTIVAKGGQGSGVVVIREGVSYVLTAGHVVSDNRQTRTVVDSKTHTTKILVYFDDVIVIRDIIEGGRLVGSISSFAEVLKYSDANFGADLALLRIRKQNFTTFSTTFYLDTGTPPIGSDLVHVGSMRGRQGANSFTTGVISQHGRLVEGIVFDQVSTTAQPGSSGCGIYLKADGRYVGMLVRGARGSDTFNFMTPVRTIIDWSRKHGIYWLLDSSVPVDLSDKTVEDFKEAPSVEERSFLTGDEYTFLINKEIRQ